MALQGSVFIRSQAFPEQLLFFHKTFAPLSHQNEKAKGAFQDHQKKSQAIWDIASSSTIRKKTCIRRVSRAIN